MNDQQNPFWKNRNVWVIAVILAVILAIFGASTATQRTSLDQVTEGDSDSVRIEMNTAAPTAEPTAEPTAAPTAEPTAEPTAAPTAEPTAEPTAAPTAEPTAEPTAAPTAEPTAEPTAAPTAEPTAEPTAAPTEEPAAEATEAPAMPQSDPVGYVLVSTQREQRLFPVFDDFDYSFTVVQKASDAEDAEEMRNTIHVINGGVYMEESTCENQDCVGEGTVTLENKDTRILMNMIICLPNQVSIELYSTEEIMAMMAEGQDEAGTENGAQP